MSVYIDVWHRTHPLTPETHRRFLDYYAEFVVAPPSDFFEVVAGFRYLDGPSNEDFALYRYASMAAIEESMMSFGADQAFIEATEALFSEIEIEELRGIALHTPYAPQHRLDDELESASGAGEPDRFLRIVRKCSGTGRLPAYELLTEYRDQVERNSDVRLILGFEYIVGPVMDLVEIWRSPGGAAPLGPEAANVSNQVLSGIAQHAPIRERRMLEPTHFSKLR